MTYEESIIVLHGLRMDYICSACEEHYNPKLKNVPRDCPLYSNCNKAHDALADAIEALEKSLPQKPSKATTRYGEFIKYECPVCSGFLIKNYPCKCGQMIDWGDE